MFADKLRDFLLRKFNDGRTASGQAEVAIRCRFCGDSQSDHNARHLYISLGDEVNNVPPMYYCFKCSTKGILTPDVLMSLVDCSKDGEMICDLRDNNTKTVKLSKNRMRKNKTYKVYNNYIRKDKLSEAKLFYINKRLGLDLTYSDLLENKIVLNLLDLLNSNKIKEYTMYDNIVKELDDSFLGFLSMDNGFINLKNLRKKGCVSKFIDRRYTNYSIFKDSLNNSRRFYSIPTKCNLMSLVPIKIHIAEGPFDILSIFYNLNNGNREQNIYMSIGGRSYLNVINLILSGMGIINCELHLYMDNDVPEEQIKAVADLVTPIGIKVYLHRNVFPNEKDFGVKLENIKDQITRI